MDQGFSEVLFSLVVALCAGLFWGRLLVAFARRRNFTPQTCRMVGIPIGLAGLLLVVLVPGETMLPLKAIGFGLFWAVLPAGFFCQYAVYPKVRLLDPMPGQTAPLGPEEDGHREHRF